MESNNSSAQEAKRKRLRKLCARFCANCTLHGLSDLYNEKLHFLKYLWFVLIAVSCAGATYGSFEIIAQYLSSPLAVSYTIAHKPTLRLPDIVLCPFTTLSKKFLRENNISDELANYVVDAFGNAPLYSRKFFKPRKSLNSLHSKGMEDELDDLITRLNISWQDFLDRSSIKCADLVLSCEIVTNMSYRCCDDAQHRIYSTFGDCIRIKSPVQSLPGFGWGLTMILRPLNEDIVFSGRSSLTNKGMSLYFADSDEWEFGDLSFFPQGVDALLAVSTIEYDLVNSKESPCSSDEAGIIRSTAMCLDLCFFEWAMKQCECHLLLLSIYVRGGRPCTPKEFRECVTPKTKEYVNANGGAHALLHQCQRRCPHACHYKEFRPRMTFANFPSSSIEKFLRPELDLNNMSDYTVVQLYHEQLVVTEIRQFPTLTAQQFLASIGGQMGLYVGGSILTIIQISIFLCKLPFLACSSKEDYQRCSTNGQQL